ncbi:hypothetical protein N7535_005560 [Penicillium sp. DV-2018c]|nr:hypothetical protein N7461_009134 [Penicillium sp. DV-2018c]KAJ5571900.1 hypothetical protein N7535_005560 [Penicillium sp. DV-2018c]
MPVVLTSVRAAWAGSRIIFKQVSPEANLIFDFVMALYNSCDGDWERLATRANLDFKEVQLFLDYAAVFLSNMGNYYGSGDQKFIPAIPKDKLGALAAAATSSATTLWEQVQDAMFQIPPLGLGPPDQLTQSTYYPGHEIASFQEDAALVTKVMDELKILPENTRVEKRTLAPKDEVLDILQASVAERISICHVTNSPTPNGKTFRLVNGDHKDQLARINAYLGKALEYVSNQFQYEVIRKIQESFTTGDLAAYKDSQRIWVNDKAPPVETVIGFIEPYRDPLGIRSEFEGIVGIPDPDQTRTLKQLAKEADEFVYRLPWVNRECGTKGPFEKEVFEAPDFSSVQSMNNLLALRCLYAYSC